MPASWNIEWLNLNGNRRYPFKEDMRLIPIVEEEEQSDIIFPNYAIVDAIFVLPSTSNVDTRVYMNSYSYTQSYLSLSFADQDNIKVGEVTINLASHITNTSYYLSAGNAKYLDAVSKVVIGQLSTLSADLPTGIFSFNIEGTELEARTVRPDIRGVHALQLMQGQSLSNLIYGDIKLVAGTNIRLRYVPVDIIENGINKRYPGIRIDAISAEGLDEECVCDTLATKYDCIRTINGVWADPQGNINIIGDDCIHIPAPGEADSGFILITDNCSRPCCGCAELEYLTTNIKLLESTLDRLNSRTDQVQTAQQNFYTNYLQTVRP